MMNSTVKSLCTVLPSFADAALIFSDESILYYTGFAVTDACLLVTADEGVLYTDSRYVEAAAAKIGGDYVIDAKGGLYEKLRGVFSSRGITRVALEADRVTVAMLSRLKEKLPDIEFVTDASLSDATDSLRQIKSKHQLDRIIAAQRISEKAFSYICGVIKPGMTEKEVQLALDFYMLSNGADALSFDTICVAGAKTSLPHGVPGDNIIRAGDFVTLDFGAVVDGYHSDMTRTVAVGGVSEEMKKIYSVVLSAQLAALDFLAPGKTCSGADASARDVIAAAGYGEYFGHSTGHGVGVEIHELPNLSPRSTAVLSVGNVVTVEPGIYLPGRFGVRIEDMAYITDGGAMNLTDCPKELTVL